MNMIRPTIYQCATKISAALILVMLWDRFINREGYFSLIADAFLAVGIFFIMLAWFQYLRMDGVNGIDGIRKKHSSDGDTEKKKHPAAKSIVDFADEKIVPFSELEEEERTMCRLAGDISCGFLFLIPALIALLIRQV